VRFVRLAALCTLTALLTSRITLLGHELVGHGVVARVLGAEIEAVGLFLFAGGWIRYRPAEWGVPSAILATLGGIALELVLGAAALVLARRRAPGSSLRFGLTAFGAIDLVHAAFYLAAGTHHGFGDGAYLHGLLGAARVWLVAPASLATILLAFAVAWRLAREARPWLAGATRGRRLAGLLAAALAAAAIHGVLAFGEARLFPQATYAAVKETESEREVARALAALREAARRRGEAIDPAALARAKAHLEGAHRQFPLLVVLGIAVAIACAAGATLALRRADDGPAAPAGFRPIVPVALACLGSIALVGLCKLLL
jgi:hypothetical protein